MISTKAFNKLKISAILFSAVILYSCASVVTEPDWKFVQSVGGISVGELEMIGGQYYLPINMSVASYTKTSMVCTDSSARVAGKEIWVKVKTNSLSNVPTGSTECPKARLGGIPDGNYRVMYVGPEGEGRKRIGEVTADLANTEGY